MQKNTVASLSYVKHSLPVSSTQPPLTSVTSALSFCHSSFTYPFFTALFSSLLPILRSSFGLLLFGLPDPLLSCFPGTSFPPSGRPYKGTLTFQVLHGWGLGKKPSDNLPFPQRKRTASIPAAFLPEQLECLSDNILCHHASSANRCQKHHMLNDKIHLYSEMKFKFGCSNKRMRSCFQLGKHLPAQLHSDNTYVSFCGPQGYFYKSPVQELRFNCQASRVRKGGNGLVRCNLASLLDVVFRSWKLIGQLLCELRTGILPPLFLSLPLSLITNCMHCFTLEDNGAADQVRSSLRRTKVIRFYFAAERFSRTRNDLCVLERK